MHPEDWSSPILLKRGEDSSEHWSLFYNTLTDVDREGGENALCCTSTVWRVIPINQALTTREHESKTIHGTFLEFSEWVRGESRADSPFSALPSQQSAEVAVYADYKYFHELFQLPPVSSSPHNCSSETTSSRLHVDGQALWLLPRDFHSPQMQMEAPTQTVTATSQHILSSSPKKLLDWSVPERSVPGSLGPLHSTVWLGSRGAHTPLHYGMYTCLSASLPACLL